MEQTLIIIKPDAVRNHNTGNIIAMYEKAGFIINEMKMMMPEISLLEKHYAEHAGKSFYEKLLSFMTSGKCVIMMLEKENAIEDARKINGATDPAKAEPDTIRYLYGTDVTINAVHASANKEDAVREIAIWFN